MTYFEEKSCLDHISYTSAGSVFLVESRSLTCILTFKGKGADRNAKPGYWPIWIKFGEEVKVDREKIMCIYF